MRATTPFNILYTQIGATLFVVPSWKSPKNKINRVAYTTQSVEGLTYLTGEHCERHTVVFGELPLLKVNNYMCYRRLP